MQLAQPVGPARIVWPANASTGATILHRHHAGATKMGRRFAPARGQVIRQPTAAPRRVARALTP
eukprot:4577207-Lingulodinium_polyedra.AAC.1